MTLIRARRNDLRLALMMLTRIPAGKSPLPADATLSRAVWAFALVGALVGALAGAVFVLAILVRLPSSVSVVVALAAAALLTGGLHEDGLADFTDGIGGGRDRFHRLEIMRDSRIGTYGAVALILAYLLRFSVLDSLDPPYKVVLAWIAAGTISRAAMVLILIALPPARTDGLGAQAAAPPRWSAGTALGLSGAISVAALGMGSLVAICAALAATGIVWRLARKHLQGYTGDVLGACAVGAECAAFAAILAWWR